MYVIKVQRKDDTYYIIETGEFVHDKCETISRATKYDTVESAEAVNKRLSFNAIYDVVEITKIEGE